MEITLIQAGQYVAVGVLVLIGQVVVARVSKQAQQAPVEKDVQAEATKAWQEYANEMKDRLIQVEQRLNTAEDRATEDRRRIAALERQGERDKELIRRLVERLRRAIEEIRRLGGSVPDADTDLTDMAQLRLDMIEETSNRIV